MATVLVNQAILQNSPPKKAEKAIKRSRTDTKIKNISCINPLEIKRPTGNFEMPQGSEAIIPSGMEWHQTTIEGKYAFTKQPLYRVPPPPPFQTLCIGKSMEAVRLEICRCESVQILQAPYYCLAVASIRLLKAFNYLCYQLLPTIAIASIGQKHRVRY